MSELEINQSSHTHYYQRLRQFLMTSKAIKQQQLSMVRFDNKQIIRFALDI